MKISKVRKMKENYCLAAKQVTPLFPQMSGPMIRSAHQRGNTRLAWLESHHTFSFGEFHDHEFPGFGVLRAINEDTLAPGAGFGTHFHQDLEIFTYVISGTLAHRDNLSPETVYLEAGQWQHISAGHGILHSERNASEELPLNYVQFWIAPKHSHEQPAYAYTTQHQTLSNRWQRVAGPVGAGILGLAQDAEVKTAHLQAGLSLDHQCESGWRKLWVQVLGGSIEVNGLRVGPGDGMGLSGSRQAQIDACEDADILLLDLPQS